MGPSARRSKRAGCAVGDRIGGQPGECGLEEIVVLSGEEIVWALVRIDWNEVPVGVAEPLTVMAPVGLTEYWTTFLPTWNEFWPFNVIDMEIELLRLRRVGEIGEAAAPAGGEGLVGDAALPLDLLVVVRESDEERNGAALVPRRARRERRACRRWRGPPTGPSGTVT